MSAPTTATDSIRMLNEQQAAETLGISVALIRRHRSKRIGCPYVKIGRRVVYRLQDVEAFIASCTVGRAR
jgi:predicted DNA-binding transcriptional regulator AlpA